MTAVKRLKLRCFLEGQEVPIVGMQVQSAPNSPMVATIQIPPISEATKIKPRTLVHVFFLDFWPQAPAHVYPRGDSVDPNDRGDASTFDYSLARYQGNVNDDTIGDIKSDINNHRYKLLFGGEVVGLSWVKTPTNRSIVLQCQDWSSYWDYAIQFKNTDLFGPGVKAMFSGGGTNLFTDFLSSPSECIINIIQSKSVQYPKMEGLLGGLVHLLEAIGGAYRTRDGKEFAGQNIFFSIAELRLRLTQMITAYEDDPSAKRLLGGQYDGLFGRTLGDLGEQVSFRSVLNKLAGVIFHESYPQPCPLYTPGYKGNIEGYERKELADDPTNGVLVTDAQAIVDSLKFLIEDVMDLLTKEGEPTHEEQVIRRDELLAILATIKKNCKDLTARARSLKFDKSVRFSTEAAVTLARAETVSKAKEINEAWAKNLVSLLKSAKDSVYRITEISTIVNKKENAVPARLNQQIFRPDVWFTAPPRCNVLFPEHYTQLNYSRSFIQEPTRLMLKVNDEFFGEDMLFDSCYFAPKLEGLKTKSSELTQMLTGDIMSHEIYTGILPIFEKMGQFNIFGVRSATAPKSTKPGQKEEKGRTPKVGLVQRTTNFLFFRYRFGARKMQIQGTFNPYIACGFPGLVIDKYVDLNKLQTMQAMMVYKGYKYRPLESMLGTHFLGNFVQVAHSIDQGSGGTTSIDVGYAREYDEAIEFLGASNKDTQEASVQLDSDALRVTDVAAIDKPPLQALGPQFGYISRCIDVTKSYLTTPPTEGTKLPFYSGPRRSGTGELLLKMPIGVVKTAKEWGPEIVELVGGENKDVSFRAYRVTESVPRYRTENILTPAEELIRPGWYGQCWAPSQIGKVYDKFFRTGSITDPQQIADPSGASVGEPSTDADDALRRSVDRSKAGEDPEAPTESAALAPAIMALEKEASIKQSVDFLLLVYAYIRMNGLDVDDFIRSYTWRPIASMVDMFGSSDLEYDKEGHKVVKGVEGFHSRAFGDYEDLFALVTPEIEKVIGVKRGSNLAKKADTRKRKWEAVKILVDALNSTKALIG